MSKNIIIIGASGHSKVIIDIIEQLNTYQIVGLIDSFKTKGIKVYKYEILGNENDIPALRKIHDFNIGIIAIGDNWTRKNIHKRIIKIAPDFQFTSAIHPKSIIGKNVKIGKGSVVMAGAIINSDAKIDEFCIINTKASLGHDSELGKYASLAPNATIGGNVKIGAFSAISLSASVIQDITIGMHSIIGAASLVNRKVGDYKMVYGIPGKVIKDISKGEKYLYNVDQYAKHKTETSPRIQVITKKENWDDLLERIGNYDFYHTYQYHMIAKLDNKKAILLKYEEGDVLIAMPLLVRQIENTKFVDATSVYGYAGPIGKGITADFDNTNFKKALMDYFVKNKYVSVFSRLNPFINNQSILLNTIGSVVNQGKIVNIDLTLDLDVQRSLYRDRLKTHINKSRRVCTVRTAETKEDLQAYIDIYYENMDRVKAKKSYYFNDTYFQSLLESDSFESTVLLAIDNETGVIIAGSMFVVTNGIVQYHLSGTKNDYFHLNPTKLLIDEMRIMATENGDTFFNLGGGLGGNNDDSLFVFKASFSKDFKDFNLWKLIVNQEVYDNLVISNVITNKSDFFPLYRSYDDLASNQ